MPETASILVSASICCRALGLDWIPLGDTPGLDTPGLGLQKRMSVNCPDVSAWVYLRQPKFLCMLLNFQGFAGWWLDPTGTWRKSFSRKSEEGNAYEKSEVRNLSGHLASIYIRTRPQPQFSVPATNFFLRRSGLVPEYPTFLLPENLKTISRRHQKFEVRILSGHLA